MDAVKNFAYGLVENPTSPATTGTVLVLEAGLGALFPVAPFDVTIWPPGVKPTATNAESARCTSLSGDTLTLLRGQYGSTPIEIGVGYQVCQSMDVGLLYQLALPGIMPGILGTGHYDPIQNIYLPSSFTGLVKTQAKFAQVDAGAGSIKIAHIGASDVAGWNGTISLRGTADPITRIAQILSDFGYPVSEPTLTMDDGIAQDSRGGSFVGSFSWSTQPSSAVVLGNAGSAGLTFISTRAGTNIDILVEKGSSSVNVLIDGVSPSGAVTVTNGTWSGGDINPASGSDTYCVATFSGLENIPHKVTILSVSSAAYGWIESYSANSVRLANFGSSSSRPSDWQDIASHYYTLLNNVLFWAPDVVILGLGIQFNGWQSSVSFASMLTSMEAIITALQTAGVEVILNGMTPGISPTKGTPTLAFWQNIYTLADATGCMLIDQLIPGGGTEAVASALGLLGGADTVHPSAAGYAGVARRIVRALGIQAKPSAVSSGKNIINRTSNAFVEPGEITLFTGSTIGQGLALPLKPPNGTAYKLLNYSTVSVNIAGISPDLIQFWAGSGAGPFAIPKNFIVELVYFNGVWYTTQWGLITWQLAPVGAGDLVYTPFTFAGTWANIGGAQIVARFIKTLGNVVHVEGAIVGGATTTVTTFPASYRPTSTITVPINLSGSVLGYGQITSAGVFTVQTEAGAVPTDAFFNFSFYADV